MTKIEWTEATWNPVRGCSRVSEGCRNCYAERIAARFSRCRKEGCDTHIDAPFFAFAQMSKAGPRWTGRVQLIPEKLQEPMRWRKPRMVFVNSMSDLFHEKLSDDDIDRVFGVMKTAKEHTFQVLTKRADRMCRYAHLTETLPNVWLGVSVEDQKTADERIPALLQTPAALRFVSYEPALGPVDFSAYLEGNEDHGTPFSGARTVGGCVAWTPGLDWVIVGGESGPHARPFDVAWAQSVIRQCRDAGIPCFVKQLGSRPHLYTNEGVGECRPGRPYELRLKSAKGGDPAEWPADLRVREWPTIV